MHPARSEDDWLAGWQQQRRVILNQWQKRQQQPACSYQLSQVRQSIRFHKSKNKILPLLLPSPLSLFQSPLYEFHLRNTDWDLCMLRQLAVWPAWAARSLDYYSMLLVFKLNNKHRKEKKTLPQPLSISACHNLIVRNQNARRDVFRSCF